MKSFVITLVTIIFFCLQQGYAQADTTTTTTGTTQALCRDSLHL
jgi:hypothetical protein